MRGRVHASRQLRLDSFQACEFGALIRSHRRYRLSSAVGSQASHVYGGDRGPIHLLGDFEFDSLCGTVKIWKGLIIHLKAIPFDEGPP